VLWTGWSWIGRWKNNIESVVQVAKQDVECELTDFRGVCCCKGPVACSSWQAWNSCSSWTGWRHPPLFRNNFISWKYCIQKTLVHTVRCRNYLFRSLYSTCLYPTIQCTFLTPTFPIPPHRLVPCRAFPFWTNQAGGGRGHVLQPCVGTWNTVGAAERPWLINSFNVDYI